MDHVTDGHYPIRLRDRTVTAITCNWSPNANVAGLWTDESGDATVSASDNRIGGHRPDCLDARRRHP